MEKIINKRRAGDENIGKLIVFAITIVIAIGLVGLVSYFYTQSREAAVNTGVLGSTSSTPADLKKVAKCTGTDVKVAYDAISNNYSLTGTTTDCDISGLKWVSGTLTGYTLSN